MGWTKGVVGSDWIRNLGGSSEVADSTVFVQQYRSLQAEIMVTMRVASQEWTYLYPGRGGRRKKMSPVIGANNTNKATL